MPSKHFLDREMNKLYESALPLVPAHWTLCHSRPWRDRRSYCAGVANAGSLAGSSSWVKTILFFNTPSYASMLMCSSCFLRSGWRPSNEDNVSRDCFGWRVFTSQANEVQQKLIEHLKASGRYSVRLCCIYRSVSMAAFSGM